MSGKREDLPEITPETRLAALLEALPELEETLYALSPTYKKLKNPVLRKTVGRVATLRQVARVGDVPLGRLINTLRAAAGMEEVADTEGEGDQGGGGPRLGRGRERKGDSRRPAADRAGRAPDGPGAQGIAVAGAR